MSTKSWWWYYIMLIRQWSDLDNESDSDATTKSTSCLRVSKNLRLLCLLELIISAAVKSPLLLVQSGLLPGVSAGNQAFGCAHVSFNLTIGIMSFDSQSKSCQTVCTEKIDKLEEKIGKGQRFYSYSVEDTRWKFENPKGHRFVDICSVTNRLCTGKHWIADTNDFALAGVGPVLAGQSCFAPGAAADLDIVSSSCRSPRRGIQDDTISCICAVTLHLYLVRLGWWKVPKDGLPYALQAGRENFNGSHADCNLAGICRRLSVKYRDLGNWICDDSQEHMLVDQVLPCTPHHAPKWWSDHFPKNRCICNTGGTRTSCRELIQSSGTQSEKAYEWVVNLPESIIKFAQARETVSTTMTTDVLSWLPMEFGDAITDEHSQGHFATGNYLNSDEDIGFGIGAGSSAISDSFSLVTDIDSLFQPCNSTLWKSTPQRQNHDQFQAGQSQGPSSKKGRYQPHLPAAPAVAASPVINAAELESLTSNTCPSTSENTLLTDLSDTQWVDEYFTPFGDWDLL